MHFNIIVILTIIIIIVWTHERISLKQEPVRADVAFLRRYSMNILIIPQIVRMRDPKAKVPRWYSKPIPTEEPTAMHCVPCWTEKRNIRN